MKRGNDGCLSGTNKKPKTETPPLADLSSILQQVSYDDALVLYNVLEQRIVEHRASLVARDIWMHIFCNNNVQELMECGIVCSTWKSWTDALTVANYGADKLLSDSLLKKFTHLTVLDLEGADEISDDGITTLTNLTELIANTRLTDEGISALTNLTHLNIVDNDEITSDGISLLTCLAQLELNSNITFPDLLRFSNLTRLTLDELYTEPPGDVLERLPRLKVLDLTANCSVSDTDICKLTNVTALNLAENGFITHDGLSDLTQLEILNLRKNIQVNDRLLSRLPNIRKLDLSENNIISDQGIQWLTGLTDLSLANSPTSGRCLLHLTNLTRLNLAATCIGDHHVSHLSNLTELNLSENFEITDKCLENFASLRSLSLYFTEHITDKSLSLLTNLTYLNISRNNEITDDGLRCLTNLTELDLFWNSIISEKGLEPLLNLKILRTANMSKIAMESEQRVHDFAPEVFIVGSKESNEEYERTIFNDDYWSQ